MKIIGITGGTGAGKSRICMELERLGAEIVDADQISRAVTKKDGAAFGEIIDFFGAEILNDVGEIDRKCLGGIVFSDKEKLKKLNEITHKHIFAEMERRLSESKKETVVLDVPLLFQSEFPIKCDLTVAVLADPQLRLKRIMLRDGIDKKSAEARMKNQMRNDEYKTMADMCIENDGDEDKIKEFAVSIVKKLG